ncbi:MAG: hypothetical protein V3V08_02635, partial [Nannocystaceae bacterium]
TDLRNATQRNATQRNATQRNATQRNATQRNATQRNATFLKSLPPITIRLERDDIEDLELRTWISQRGNVLTVVERRGRTFISPETARYSSVPEGVAVGRTGTLVSFGVPHQLSLPDGVYVEHIDMTIAFRTTQRRPIQQRSPRFFRILDGRVQSITSTEYSDESDPLEPAVGSDGEPEMVHRGVGESNKSKTKQNPHPNSIDPQELSGDSDASETNTSESETSETDED